MYEHGTRNDELTEKTWPLGPEMSIGFTIYSRTTFPVIACVTVRQQLRVWLAVQNVNCKPVLSKEDDYKMNTTNK